jgi:hypothetical protein
MSLELLPLDHKIRDWVLLPILILSVLVGLGRQAANNLLTTRSTKLDVEGNRPKSILQRSGRLRANANLLTPAVFQARKSLFDSKKTGLLRPKKAADNAAQPNPLQNPDMMNQMMKQQVTQMMPQMAMMGFVSYFFSGFVTLKVPFPLTNGFREMLQRGVMLTTLDVSYVSSLSVYFMCMFGLSGLFSLLLSGPIMDDMQMQMQMQQQQQQQPFDAAKAFAQERESLELVHHKFFGPDAEARLIKMNVE